MVARNRDSTLVDWLNVEVKGGGFFLFFFKFQLLRGKEYTNSRKSSAKGFLKSPFQIRSFFFHGVDFALIIKRIECRKTYLVSSEEGKEGRRSGRIKKNNNKKQMRKQVNFQEACYESWRRYQNPEGSWLLHLVIRKKMYTYSFCVKSI